MDENLKNLNKLVGNYEQVSTIQLILPNLKRLQKEYKTLPLQQYCRGITICFKTYYKSVN